METSKNIQSPETETKEYVYRGNKIIRYPDGTFLATVIKDGDVLTKTCPSLSHARRWIMKHESL